MSFLTHDQLPTQEQIIKQFTHGNIDQSLANPYRARITILLLASAIPPEPWMLRHRPPRDQ
jgi:hypothetical protein